MNRIKKQTRTLCCTMCIPLCSTLLTAVLLLVFASCYGIFPLGTKAIVWCDMEQQAVPLLVQLRTIAERGESIAYTTLNAGGMSFYGVFFFFLSNPLSALIFCTDIPADRLVGVLVFCKLALAAGTSTHWFQLRCRRLPAAECVLLGMMYAFSGYGLYYYQNLMWLDVMLMLPVLLLGLRQLTTGKSPWCYTITLCLMMVLCFYLCYMLILFVLLYVAITLHETVPKKQRGVIALRFWGHSLLAALLTAPVWIPCYLQVSRSARGVPLLQSLASTPILAHLEDKLSLLACSALALAAIPFLFQKGKPLTHGLHRDRLLFFLLTAATVLGPINTMWHTGSYQAFPYRWGMISILLLLTLAAKQLARRPNPPQAQRKPVRLCLLTACGIGCCLGLLFLADPTLHSYVKTLWISDINAAIVLALACFLGVIYYRLMVARKATHGKLPLILMALLFLAESGLHFNCYIGAAASEDPLYQRTLGVKDCYHDPDGMERIKLTKKYAHANMLGAMGFPSLAHYTSLTRADFLYGVKRMGYGSYWMEVPSTGGTVLSDAFWHIRWQLGARQDMPEWTTPFWTDGLYHLGENQLTLPAAFYTPLSPADIATLPTGNRGDVQRFLAAELGIDDPVISYAPTDLRGLTLQSDESGVSCQLASPETDGEIRYSLFISGKQALYFDLHSEIGTELKSDFDEAVTVRVNGRTILKDYPAQKYNGLVSLGQMENEYVVVSVTVASDFECESFGVFGMDMEKLEAGFAAVEGERLTCQGGVYRADCNPHHAQTLILSCAYDEGLYATYNGKPLPIERVNECQAAVVLPAEAGQLEIRFRVSGLRLGILLALLGACGSIPLCLLYHRLPQKWQRRSCRVAAKLLTASYVMILICVYCMPVLVCLLQSGGIS